jgi:Family of unknown function (DUF5522)
LDSPEPAAALSENILRAHADAIARGEPSYLEPLTGFTVLTAATLLAQGECCGSSCRHCPYPEAERHRAGRPST